MTHTIIYSESESKRFNMKVYRGIVEDVNVKLLKKIILQNEIDILIFSIKSEKNEQIPALDRLGFPYLQADTLVYYYLDLEKYQIKELRNKDLEFQILTKKNDQVLDSLVDEIFSGYTNHYNSNPYLSKQSINESYKEWVRGFLSNEGGKTCYLVKKDGVNAGFATVTAQDGVGEGVLYGVLPSFSGMGIYSDIIRFTQKELKNQGCKEMKVSTQVQNYAVQKVWGKEGFWLKESFATIHINSLLSYSELPSKKFSFRLSEDEISEYGKVSGDYNPVHFDDTFAKSLGFKSRIVHGLTLSSILSKFYGTEFPGHGTLFLGYNFLFMAPVYPNMDYHVEVNILKETRETSLYESLAKVKDAEGNICVICRSHLKANKNQ
jgi:acyl dehydratase/ribosomal protein S18 acetylase RimI-like enzyme